MTVHATAALADGLDGALLLAAAVGFALRRSRLTTVTLLLAAAPLWSQGADALHLASLGSTAVAHAAAVIVTAAPVWTAFMVGLPPLFAAGATAPGDVGR